jgi:hypothetical protein
MAILRAGNKYQPKLQKRDFHVRPTHNLADPYAQYDSSRPKLCLIHFCSVINFIKRKHILARHSSPLVDRSNYWDRTDLSVPGAQCADDTPARVRLVTGC